MLPKVHASDLSIWSSIAVMECHDQKQVGKASISTLQFITEGSQDRNSSRAGTWRQEQMQRPWRGAAYWFAPHGLLSPLSYRTQDHQLRVAPPSIGVVLHYQSPIKEMAYRLT